MDESTNTEMQWKVCPAQLQPWKGACAWISILGTVIIIFEVNPIAGIGSLAFLLGTLGTFIFPTAFTLDSKGIHAKYTISAKYYTWEQVRRAMFFKDSCILSTRKKQTLIGGSGMRVYFGNQATQISQTIKSHLNEGITT
jgi:hypothetical protein